MNDKIFRIEFVIFNKMVRSYIIQENVCFLYIPKYFEFIFVDKLLRIKIIVIIIRFKEFKNIFLRRKIHFVI